jgi:hypothetical protein
MNKLTIVPIKQDEAKAFINQKHRHHKAPIGSIFQIAVAKDEKIVGVAMVGRPVSRHLDNGWTLEVNRLCTDGTKNACSMLYSASWRVAKNLGYKKLITYILSEETGASLKASNWKCIGEAGGGSWNCENRPRVDKHPTQKKIKFEIE